MLIFRFSYIQERIARVVQDKRPLSMSLVIGRQRRKCNLAEFRLPK
jgi:hypothetical protein